MKTLIGTVPERWTQVLLGDVCAVVAGPGSIGRSEDRASSGVPIVAPRNIRHNRIVADDLMFTTADAAAKLSRYRLAMGDVVCTRTGELGRNALVAEGQAGWLLGAGCMRLRSTGRVIATYLTYYLANPAVRDWIQRNATSSAISSISARTLSRMPIVLPPLSAQCRIGEVLDALDDKIAVHDQISTATAALRDSLSPLLMTGYGSFVDY
ncbi:MAG TPA: restriction endonuclease subunit S [Pseudonocardiaceae bacterium]|nr:restriction endonuclease subunit S [Pseudonocardiaceae bacterium]